MEGGSLAQSQFPDIYREFESLQAQVRRAAHDYIISPQAGSVPLEVRNIEVRLGELANMLLALDVPTHRSGLSCGFQVARSLGILDEVNRMKVVPGTSPSSRQTHKTARYMEVSTDTLQIGYFCFFFFVSSIIRLLPPRPHPSWVLPNL